MNSGTLIVFEGIDGCGKTTQINILTKRLKKLGKDVFNTQEPSNNQIGKVINNMMQTNIEITDLSMFLMIIADRIDHITNPKYGIISAMSKNKIVISDRYYLSTFAYQSGTVPYKWIKLAYKTARDILKPSIIFYLDISPKRAIKRINSSRVYKEIYDEKNMINFAYKNYKRTIKKLQEKENIVIIDANQSKEDIANEIWEYIVNKFIGVDDEKNKYNSNYKLYRI